MGAVGQVAQEWWIHVAQLDLTDVLAEHPLAWPIVIGVVVAPIGVLLLCRDRLPRRDWPLALNVVVARSPNDD